MEVCQGGFKHNVFRMEEKNGEVCQGLLIVSMALRVLLAGQQVSKGKVPLKQELRIV